MSAIRLTYHPLREGVMNIIEKHFSPEIAKRFVMELEYNLHSRDYKDIWNQGNNQSHVLDVRYKNPDGTVEFVTDISSQWNKKIAEAHLLRMITDKVKDGKIGHDWVEKDGRLSTEITSGEFETRG